MTKIYDYVFVTHLPAFYKINLYNKLAENLSILVVFISGSSLIRTQDFVQAQCCFDHIIINQQPFEQRPRLRSCLLFMKMLNQVKFKKMILGGWDLSEFWIAWGRYTKKKLAVAIESSVHESTLTGPKSWLKKIFLSKISTAYVSGLFQKNLIEQLNYNQHTVVTGGVGLINPPVFLNKNGEKPKSFRGRFLFLGRLSEEKNIDLLMDLFGKNLRGYQLTLVGKGPLGTVIENQVKDNDFNNILLQSHVPNTAINQLFDDHDVLILSSRHEPWGLVVEEAIAYGLPVIASDKVGCHPELIKHKINGYIFNLYKKNREQSIAELTEACHWVDKNYESLIENATKYPAFDWRKREQRQIGAYLSQLGIHQ